jgi:molybdopterin-guanine dinucleotide biosynthesis protein A
MGGVDKALVALGGHPLISHSIQRLAPQVGAIAISAQGDPARFAGFGLEVIADPLPGRLGPLAGILAAMDWAQEAGAAHVASVPVDGPFFSLDLVARLGCGPRPRLARAGGRGHPTYGVWPVALAVALRAFLVSGAKPRMRDFAGLAAADWVDFADPSGFDNLNSQDDLARAEARL